MPSERLIRWVGDPGPWSDPTLAGALARQEIPVPIARKLQDYNKYKRQLCIPGRTQRGFGPKEGFSQSYTFGPYEFTQRMSAEDAAYLFTNEWDRWQFIDVTDMPSLTERPPLTLRQWHQLLASFEKLGYARVLARPYR
jgi:hypothetical protein